MKTNLPYKEIKFMGPHEYAMRQAWEKKKAEDLRKIQEVAGIAFISSFMIGWLVIVVASLIPS